MHRHALGAILAAILICSWAAVCRSATATFENFNEGQFFPTGFTDPLSGIVFSDPPSFLNFTIEYADSFPGLPTITPGHYLTGGGFVPGGGFAIAFGFGFTATLPSLASTAGFDFIYGETGPLTVQAFDDSSQIVGQTTLNPPFLNFVEGHAVVQSLHTDIRRIVVSAAPGLAIGYDNIGFDVPEPGCAAGLVLIAAVFGISRTRIFAGPSHGSK